MWSSRVFILSLLILNIFTIHFVSSMSEVLVELQAPRFVIYKNSVTLYCEHNVDPEHLYKVVFFKHTHRIMQFVRGREPPFVPYNISGAVINMNKTTPTSITLDKMGFEGSGTYACEIALDAPLYSKISKGHEITVVVRQKQRPRIKIKNRRFVSGDVLEAGCTSGAAHPAPHLTWFINNVKVDEKYTNPHGAVNVHSHRHGMTLLMTNSSLRFPIAKLQLIPNQTLDLSCVSTIPGFVPSLTTGFADIQNNTISVNVVRIEPAPTQLPVKIIDLQNKSSSFRDNIMNISLLFFVLYIKFNIA